MHVQIIKQIPPSLKDVIIFGTTFQQKNSKSFYVFKKKIKEYFPMNNSWKMLDKLSTIVITSKYLFEHC